MKKLLGILSVVCIVFMMSSCVEDAYEEIEVSEIEVQMSDTDEDDIPPNPPGGCGACQGNND